MNVFLVGIEVSVSETFHFSRTIKAVDGEQTLPSSRGLWQPGCGIETSSAFGPEGSCGAESCVCVEGVRLGFLLYFSMLCYTAEPWALRSPAALCPQLLPPVLPSASQGHAASLQSCLQPLLPLQLLLSCCTSAGRRSAPGCGQSSGPWGCERPGSPAERNAALLARLTLCTLLCPAPGWSRTQLTALGGAGRVELSSQEALPTFSLSR